MIIHDLKTNLFNHVNLMNVIPDFIDKENDWLSFVATYGSRELAIPKYINESTIDLFLTDKLYSYRKLWYNYNEMVERAFVASAVMEVTTDSGDDKQGSFGDDGQLIDDVQTSKQNVVELEKESLQFSDQRIHKDYVQQVFRDVVNAICYKVY